MKKAIFLFFIFLASQGCSTYKKQFSLATQNVLMKNSCYNDECDLKNMLEMLKLTKSKWSKIEFDKDGIKYFHNYLKDSLPILIAECNLREKKKQSDDEIFKILVAKLFDNLASKKQVFNQRNAEENLNFISRWLLGSN